MPVRDHQGITLSVFNGLWNRGTPDTVPIDHFSDCNNIDFTGSSSFRTRDGIIPSQTVDVPLANIKRIYNYPTQTNNTLIILAVNEITGIGSIYHYINSTTIYGPILSIAGMTDFAFVPYAGRGYISPFSSSQPILSPPNPLLAVIAAGAGLGVGIYNYAVTFVNALGETNPSSLTAVTTVAALANPSVAPIISDLGAVGSNFLTPGATYKWKVAFSRGGLLTNVGPASIGFVAPATTEFIGMDTTNYNTATSDGASLFIYRTIANGSTYYLEESNITIQNVGGINYILLGGVSDAAIVANPVAPSTNSTQQQQVNLSSIPTDPTGNATSRNIYRTVVNGSQLKLLASLANNTTTLYGPDTTVDGSLGVNAPTINTAYVSTQLIEKGMSGQPVYVYAGDGTNARPAAGAGLPNTPAMTVGYGSGGFMDLGIHIFGIVTQTKSGYNAPPGALTLFNVAFSNSLSFGNIPTSGDPNVVSRLLVSTIAIPAAQYNGNLSGYQFFFVPGAVINNNTDTFLNNISFYDSELLQDASQLLDNYTTIPAGAVLSVYHNRLIVATTATDISLALVSQPGQPEAIDQISGLIIVPLDGNPITNAQEFRDVLYMFKRTRTSAYADNGGDPSSWVELVIDTALGTSVHGVATSLDSGKSAIDNLIVATFQGISLFNGKYTTPELTWKIIAFWQQLNQNNFNLIQIVNEPITKKLYAVLPNRQILMGDYNNGMDYKNIRWSPWTFNLSPANPGVSTVAVWNINEIIIGADLV